jgi:photosystem II stability/assembly factor-like uncharacterized protein
MRSRLLLVSSLAVLMSVGAAPAPAFASSAAALDLPSHRAPASGLPARLAAQRAAEIRTGFRFAPLGVKLLGTATLTGALHWNESPWAGAEVGWAVPVGTAIASGITTTAADGTYTLTGVTPASGNGIVAAAWQTDSWGPYIVGREAASWPDATATQFDLITHKIPIDGDPGGPWPTTSARSVSLYGSDAISRLFSRSRVEHNGMTGNYPLTLAGTTDKAAVYFWSDEGVEYDTLIGTPAGGGHAGSAVAIDASTAWTAGLGELSRTTDGGLTWTRMTGGDGYGGALCFSDAQHGWFLGYSMYATVDGGATWTPQTPSTTGQLFGADAVDDQHVWAVGKNGAITVTADGGALWTNQSSGVAGDLWDVDFVDASHGWAVGEGGVILATSNGGGTWARQKSGTTLRLWAVAFADALHGYAVGGAWDPVENVVLTTSDGGATWVRRTSGTAQTLYDVDCTDALHAWIVGERGTIRTTTDGGVTWVRRDPATTSTVETAVTSIDMASDGLHGWAMGVGAIDFMLATSDGGLTWARQLNLSANQADAQRIMIKTPYWASGKPGTSVKMLLQQFRKGFVSAFSGYSEYPAGAPTRSLGSYTSKGNRNEYKTLTVPSTAKPGYWYLLGVKHSDGVLYLETPFQVCTLKASKTAIPRGGSVKLSCVVPTQGHWGSTAGKRKPIAVYQRTTEAGQPTVWDPTKKGWKLVGVFRADGFGKFTTKALKPTRTTWYVVQYAGDDWYWGAFTSVVKVKVY